MMSSGELRMVPVLDLTLWIALSFFSLRSCPDNNFCSLSPNSKCFCLAMVKALQTLSDSVLLSLYLSADIFIAFLARVSGHFLCQCDGCVLLVLADFPCYTSWGKRLCNLSNTPWKFPIIVSFIGLKNNFMCDLSNCKICICHELRIESSARFAVSQGLSVNDTGQWSEIIIITLKARVDMACPTNRLQKWLKSTRKKWSER